MSEMIKKRILLVAFICMLLLAFPVFGFGAGNKDLGKDWYCSEPEGHTADYQKHLKQHISQGAEAIAADLEKIYSNQSLTEKDKHDKTIEVLNRYLLRIKAGTGD
jgi:hypothetical protein